MKPSLKKTILTYIASIAGLLLLAALGLYLYFIMQFNVYQDDLYKFSIKYPKSWKVMVHPQLNVAVIFLRPKDTALDALQENFNVTVQALPQEDMPLAAFSASIKRQMRAVFGKNINYVQDENINWGWRQGHQMVFVAVKPDHMEMLNAWALRENKAYIMTFLGDMNKYSKDKFYVGEMVRSLQLL